MYEFNVHSRHAALYPVHRRILKLCYRKRRHVTIVKGVKYMYNITVVAVTTVSVLGCKAVRVALHFLVCSRKVTMPSASQQV